MTNIIIIHGAYGNPEENRFPWLKAELERLACNVFVPKFPTPKNQSLENWRKVFEDYKNKFDIDIEESHADTILVGHSLGPAFLLDLLENLENPVNSSFFVSGFIGSLNNSDFDKINKTFTERNFNWERIKQNCRKFNIYYSDNDPYVPLEKSIELADKLDKKPIIIQNAGHFNKESGYNKFELLLKDIEETID